MNSRKMTVYKTTGSFFPVVVLFAIVLIASGCSDKKEKNDSVPKAVSAKLNECISQKYFTDRVTVNKIDSVDLLFVIDKSESMIEEQAKIRDQFARIVTVLTSGDKHPEQNPDGLPQQGKDFTPSTSLHLAVVTSDLGVPAVTNRADLPDQTCSGIGDDGWFQNNPHPTIEGLTGTAALNCKASYPTFITFTKDNDSASLGEIATDFACIAGVGPIGCGFEQQLEAGLKALWPSNPTQAQEDAFENNGGGKAITFLGSTQGHGDSEQHAGFLRGTSYYLDTDKTPSLLAIIVVSDENDCSVGALGNQDILKAPKSTTLPAFLRSDPSKAQKLNLRCWYDSLLPKEQQNRYPIERYVAGFKSLRGVGAEYLTIFGAIVGIPVQALRDNPDIDTDGDGEVSDAERDDYYQSILDDRSMQENEDLTDPRGGYLNKACVLNHDKYDPSQQSDASGEFGGPRGEPYLTEAEPGRRFVEVAKAFGANGVVRSICEKDFTPVMDNFIDAISSQLGGVCLKSQLERNGSGEVECSMVWTMPEGQNCKSDPELEPFLSVPEGSPTKTSDGRSICIVHQIPVVDPEAGTGADPFAALKPGELGWYYDDFSASIAHDCMNSKQRISFLLSKGTLAPEVDPPSGVTVAIRCKVDYSDSDAPSEASNMVPETGIACKTDADCRKVPSLYRPFRDYVVKADDLFCYAKAKTCVQKCSKDSECYWPFQVCDKSASTVALVGKPICVEASCGTSEE